ncbi:MAG: hypothetical protein LLG06_13105 [Desulfobacteraceae bacterium]|nr:hypothetical protein [Desulfobacteraceae bacterium]
MLLISKTGRIFDVPEQVAERYVATGFKESGEAVGEMLKTLHDRASVYSEEEGPVPCCQLYANYCPQN